MTANPADQRPIDTEAPLNSFSQCHAGILSQLEALAGLPALMAAAAQARLVAASTLALFQRGMVEHHADEERELFPAVLRSAQGAERDRVQAVVERLTGEHRTMEALWKRIEPALNAGAKGKPTEVDEDVVAELVRAYTIHARFEEQELLPLAQTILGRNGNHMAALGLSLHMQHAPSP